MNGLYKACGDGWQSGSTLHYVMGDICWSRWPATLLPMPQTLTRWLTWIVLAWELAFPVLVLVPATRKFALAMGILFHVGTGVSLELGMFPLYALCLYLPLLPWERVTRASFQPGRSEP